jgi:hypothetical protein
MRSAALFQFRFAVVGAKRITVQRARDHYVRLLREVCCPSNAYLGRDQKVGFGAIGIALLGFGVGLAFRFNVLLAVLLLLLLLSIGYSIANHVGFLKGVLTIMAAQIIAQGSYFLGLVVRSWMRDARRWVLI